MYNYYFDDTNIVEGLDQLHRDVSDLRSELAGYELARTEVHTSISNSITFVSVLLVIILGVKVMFDR